MGHKTLETPVTPSLWMALPLYQGLHPGLCGQGMGPACGRWTPFSSSSPTTVTHGRVCKVPESLRDRTETISPPFPPLGSYQDKPARGHRDSWTYSPDTIPLTLRDRRPILPCKKKDPDTQNGARPQKVRSLLVRFISWPSPVFLHLSSICLLPTF